ncbi:MAG: hypothetical protein KC457_04485 [Myxococcales bacterium]|nr:hypothetical protein [Myxococcales bacterium]
MRRLTPVVSTIALVACAPSEAPRVDLPVIVDGSGVVPVTNDLGWTVELSTARVAIRDLEFTTAGEVDERRFEPGAWLLGLLLPSAHAHPGHYQGGEIVGELPGDFVLDFVAGNGETLGVATLIATDYTAANFELRRADELATDDPLHGHTAWLAGTASKDGQQIAFTVAIDSPIDRELVGAPFETTVTVDSDFSIGLQLLTLDPYELDTLFDGLDFATLDLADGVDDGQLDLVDPELVLDQPQALQDGYNLLRRTFQTHDHFDLITVDP